MSKKIFFFFSIILITLTFLTGNVYAKSREQILATANGQLGVSYRYGGTTPAGFDCSGFVQYVFRKNGISLPRTSYDQFKAGKSIAKSELKPGDLVFFNTYGSGASHVGIYAGNAKFIHASTTKGVTYDSLNDPYYWSKKFIGARRVLPDVSPEEELRKKIEALPAGHYIDVPENHWAHEAIKQLSLNNVINGVKKGYFYPNAAVTRAEAATIFTRAMGLKASSNETFAYTDINENHWAYDAVMAATESGFFSGEGEFRPNESLTRGELADILANAYELSLPEQEIVFADLSREHPFYDEIMLVAANDIMKGFDDGTFRPNEKVKRDQLAMIVYTLTGK